MDDWERAGHVWLPPPFEIVDPSLSCQAYRRGEERLLPSFLVAETGKRIQCSATDYCSSEVVARAKRWFGSLPEDVHVRLDPRPKRPLGQMVEFKFGVRGGCCA